MSTLLKQKCDLFLMDAKIYIFIYPSRFDNVWLKYDVMIIKEEIDETIY